ncbi:MAG: GNAT family N-acetyltransferase [Paludibacteraceae bacterium]|nr:GNAT family N-acetyltransferase [Paludibacteraceae bacterium]
MAKTHTQDYSIRRGKLSKDSPLVYRTRNGKQHSYTPKESSVPPSKAQKAHRKLFGKVTSIVNAIMADPQQAAEWNERRIAYNKTLISDPYAKRYKTTRSYVHFVISSQLEQKEAAKRRRKPIAKALPKGLKLNVKHFAELSTTELYELLKARFIVFYAEQNCRYLDLDDIDYKAIHLALHRQGRVIAYARIFPSDNPKQWFLGRLLSLERGQGLAHYIVEQAEAVATQQGATELALHAQTQVAAFYEKLHYQPEGNIFIEADIPHVLMKKELSECKK